MAKDKCPYCGGNLEFNEDGLIAICDSCGESFSLSEINNLKIKRTKLSVHKKDDEKKEFHKSAFVNKYDLEELKQSKLLEQLNLALTVGEWSIADSVCNELLRRDPTDANAYLYKILIHFHIEKKEDLATLNQETLDMNYYNNGISKNYYRLVLKFADESLKKEIKNYNDILINRYKEKIEQERIGREELNQQVHLAFEKSEKEKQEKLNALRKKEKIKKSLFFIIPIVVVIVGIIISCITNLTNNELYKSENFKVMVTNKSNTQSNNLNNGYTYIFKFKIINNSKKEMSKLGGVLTVDNIENNHLFIGEVDLSGSVAAGSYGEWSVTAYGSSDNASLELYNTEYSGLNIYFRIVSIYFSDGTNKRYENRDVRIKSADADYIHPNYTYAMEMYNQGKYKEAKTLFEALGNYKDSLSMIQQCNQRILESNQETYQNGVEYFNQQDYVKAYNSFISIKDYLDSESKINQIQNIVKENAEVLISKGEYSTACTEMSNVGISNESDIYNACFYASKGYYSDLVAYGIKDVMIASEATEILERAFDLCLNLNSVTIPDTVTRIEGYVFWHFHSLGNINYLGSKSQWEEIIKENAWAPRDIAYTVICTDAIYNSLYDSWSQN